MFLLRTFKNNTANSRSFFFFFLLIVQWRQRLRGQLSSSVVERLPPNFGSSCRSLLTSPIDVYGSIVLPFCFPKSSEQTLSLSFKFSKNRVDVLRPNCWNCILPKLVYGEKLAPGVRKPGQGRTLRGAQPSTLTFFRGCPAGIYFLLIALNFTLIIFSPTVPWCWNQVLT